MTTSVPVHSLARPFVLLALLASSSPALAAPELVYVAIGERTPPGARAGDPARIAERLAAAGGRVRRVELTAPGVRAEEIRQDLLGQAVSLRPKVVTLSIGAGDACGTTELRRFARDLHIVTELLRRNSGVVVLSTLDVTDVPEGSCSRTGPALRRRVDAFNAVIVRAATQNNVLLAQVRPAGEGTASRWEVAVAAELDAALSPAARALGARPSPRG